MAFLCPVRMRRDKKKATNANIERDLPVPGAGLNHGMGRITGSSSIETLVRVGIEKEHGLSPDSKMVVLHDFTPCVDDELEVKRGQIVNILYRENDWVYVIGQDSRQEGFIPYSYCAPYNTQLAELAIKKKLPREQSVLNIDQSENAPLLAMENLKLDEELENNNGSNSNNNLGSNTNVHANQNLNNNSNGTLQKANMETAAFIEPDAIPFIKEPSGRCIVLYTFIARDENDLSVERGEFVTILNRDDPDWVWIVRSDGQEGFVPSSFVYPAESVLQTQQKLLNAVQQQGQDALTVSNNANVGGGVVVGGIAAAHSKTPGLTASDLASTMVGLNSLGQTINVNGQLDVAGMQQQQSQQQQQQQQQQQHLSQQPQQQQVGIGTDDLRYHGTELVMLYDYKAQAPDDLSVRRGDWIYADLNNQTVDGWLWAYAPKTRKYGFIPKAYARPPAMTSL